MNFSRLLLIVVCIASLPVVLLASPVEITYSEKLVQDKQDKDKKPVKTEKLIKQVVTLFPHKFSVKNNNQETIYDFEKKTVVSIDNEHKTFKKIPIYWDVSFKELEKANRTGMAKMMQAAKLGSGANQFELETIFSLAGTEPLKPAIEESTKKDVSLFKYNGEEVANFELDTKQVPEDIKDTYKKYLIYSYQIHPEIRKKLLESNAIYKSLHFRTKPFFDNTDTYTYTLESVKEIRDTDIAIPSDYKETFGTGRLGTLLESAQDTSKRKPEDYYPKEIESLLKKHNHLDAFLAMNEYMFQYKVQPGDLLKKVFTEAPEGSPARTVMGVLGAKTPEQYQQAIKILESLPREKLQHGYILDIFIANDYAKLRNLNKAAELMTNALEKNPFMVGAYKDLGDFYFAGFDVGAAWQIWDTAIELRPEHGQIQPVVKFKSVLETKYPDYF